MSNDKKILFMDVDGCLCTLRSHLSHGEQGTRWHEWDDLACNVLRKCRDHGMQIVVSSTWRYEKHRADLLFQMQKHGLFGGLYQPDWFTKDLIPEGTHDWVDYQQDLVRGKEIEEWLSRHPEVTDYRILDDIQQFLPSQRELVVLCDMDNGMSAENIRQLMRWSGALKS